MSPTNIFAPVSTPAESIFGLSVFVFSTVAGIFVVVFALLAYAVVRFRSQRSSSTEPAQIYGSTQVELAWTVIPVLIVVALFLAATRVILVGPKCAASGQCTERYRHRSPVLVGISLSRFEYRYSKRTPCAAKRSGASDSHLSDTAFCRYRPQLLGPAIGRQDRSDSESPESDVDRSASNRVFLGQCAQYCGTQHAKMLIRVYVQPREEFERWVHEQQQLPRTTA